MIFYESPHRLLRTLQQFVDVFGADRQVSVCREISKLHEESVRGTLAEVTANFEETAPRGEIVIVLAGADKDACDKVAVATANQRDERAAKRQAREERRLAREAKKRREAEALSDEANDEET